MSKAFSIAKEVKMEAKEPIGLSLGQAAQLVGFSTSTLLRWEKLGYIPKAPRRSSGWRCYGVKEIAYIKEFIALNYEEV
jgi:DNA-binding transcriptional MerR regulator